MVPTIATLNAGSASFKFALFECAAAGPVRRLRGAAGLDPAARRAVLRLQRTDGGGVESADERVLPSIDVAHWAGAVIDVLRDGIADGAFAVVGHRIVHGGDRFVAPTRLDEPTLAALHRLAPLAPLHQPFNLAAVSAAAAAFPRALQVGCFDTAFHHGHPRVADVYALPARWREAGVRRYGFHGLSYEFVMGELLRIDPRCGAGRVAIAHLGNGASLCALQGGRSIDSTMGFSVLDGLPMGTRCGQLDPGAVLYLQQTHGLDAEAVADLLYHRSGLLGLSGLSHDMRVLERAAAAGHEGARLAIDCYVYRVRREIGAAAAALGGLDALVFTGGIGENAAPLRARVCESLDWLGLAFDASANASAALRAGAAHRLSTAASRVAAYVIPTDEELLIARACAAMLRT